MFVSLTRWLERLSLDAVMVALLWGLALEEVSRRQLRMGDILVLSLATWLTYVADRLRDAGSDRETPQTDRHLFHERNRKPISLIWLALFALSFLIAVILLPVWKLLWGWVLVMAIVAYLWVLGQRLSSSRRLLLKRIAVPLIFTAGVCWMTESWRTREGILASLVLLAGALANVLLISYQENRDKGYPPWLPRALGGSLFGLLLLGNGFLLLHWPFGVAALYGAAVYFILLLQVKARGVEWIRLWVDATLADMAILILVLEYFFF
ncbi:MAG: hypothetical protein ACP5I4_03210 [Oceanipulchritudo sp.]